MNILILNLSPRHYRILFVSYLVLIFVGSSIPADHIPDSRLFANDKLLHIIEYFLLGYLIMKSIGQRTVKSFFLGVGICLFFAGLDEFYQSLIPGRMPDWLDFLADNFGIWLGAGFGISFNFGNRDD